MLKISSENRRQLALMTKKAAAGIRLLVAENTQLREKIASLEVAHRIENLKEAMDERGTSNPWGTEAERDKALRKAASEGKLDVLEQAVQLTPNLSIAKIGEVYGGSGRSENKPSSQSKAELDAYIMGVDD